MGRGCNPREPLREGLYSGRTECRIDYQSMACLPEPHPLERDFKAVRSDLENVTAKLESASDPVQRRRLLRELNLLLEEADRLIAEAR